MARKMGGDPLNPAKRDNAALFVAQGERGERILEKLGISARTLVRWKKLEDFGRRVKELRAEMIETTLGRTSALSAEASLTLGRLLKSTSEGIQLAAARALIQLAGGLHKDIELSAKFDELKTVYDELKEKIAKLEQRKK
jgi:DNA mismatch repair ATPase MutS